MIFGLFFSHPYGVCAKVYKYVDDQGKVHYTNNESNIPIKYRSGPSMKPLRGFSDPKLKKPESKEDSNSTESQTPEKPLDDGFSKKDEALVQRSITNLKNNVLRVKAFDDVVYNFTNGRRLVTSIQGGLPAKEKLASDLASSKVPELLETKNFLNQSIQKDKQAKSVGLGLKTHLVAMFNRVRGEAKTQQGLISKLEKALEKDKEKKELAKKEKAEKEKNEKEKVEKNKKNEKQALEKKYSNSSDSLDSAKRNQRLKTEGSSY